MSVSFHCRSIALFAMFICFNATSCESNFDKKGLKQLIDFEMMQMHFAFEKELLSSATLSCTNQASERIGTEYPFAEYKWKHNSNDFKIQPARMTYNLDSLTINNLIPTDSGTYHCEMVLDKDTKMTVAIYTIIVGNITQHVRKGDKLKLVCNTAEFGKLFKDAKRQWTNPKGERVYEASAGENEESISGADDEMVGQWTCKVRTRNLDRTWTTSRVFVIVDDVASKSEQMKIYVRNHLPGVIIMMIGLGIAIALPLASIAKTFRKKKSKVDKEFEAIRKGLGVKQEWEDEPLDDTPLLTTENETMDPNQRIRKPSGATAKIKPTRAKKPSNMRSKVGAKRPPDEKEKGSMKIASGRKGKREKKKLTSLDLNRENIRKSPVATLKAKFGFMKSPDKKDKPLAKGSLNVTGKQGTWNAPNTKTKRV